MSMCQFGMHINVQGHGNANVCKQTYDACCVDGFIVIGHGMAPHTMAYYGVTQTKITPVLHVVCILPDLSNGTSEAVQLNATSV